ncbi:Hypothetical predicted protein [Xyrichtys novacula]|uniref:Uncharacterized protein n=1 Tax=Xyrichtys novacula TaxID=13765 RepID=A0AAV1H678_XYRNO|nr:Hypothetical predicted protein [Xyrichtys novacula]
MNRTLQTLKAKYDYGWLAPGYLDTAAVLLLLLRCRFAAVIKRLRCFRCLPACFGVRSAASRRLPFVDFVPQQPCEVRSECVTRVDATASPRFGLCVSMCV